MPREVGARGTVTTPRGRQGLRLSLKLGEAGRTLPRGFQRVCGPAHILTSHVWPPESRDRTRLSSKPPNAWGCVRAAGGCPRSRSQFGIPAPPGRPPGLRAQKEPPSRASPSLRAPRSLHTHPPGPAPAGLGHIWLPRATSGYLEACPGPHAFSQGSGRGRGQTGFPTEISRTRTGSGSSCKCLCGLPPGADRRATVVP